MLCDRLLFCLPHKTLDEGENIVVHWSWHSRTRDFNAWYPRCTHTHVPTAILEQFLKSDWTGRILWPKSSSVISLDPQIPYTPFGTFKRLYEERDLFSSLLSRMTLRIFNILSHCLKSPWQFSFCNLFSRLFKHYARILYLKMRVYGRFSTTVIIVKVSSSIIQG